MGRRFRLDAFAALVVVGGFWIPLAVGASGLRMVAGLFLGAVAGAAMLLRHFAPVPAVVVAALATGAGAVLGVTQDPMLAAAWCLYPVAAARADRARGLAVGAVCGLGVLSATVAVPEEDARALGQRVLVAAIVLGGAWLLGTAAGRQARAAETEERARVQAVVARDVHDVVGHALAVIAAEAGVARMVSGSDPDELRRSLADVETHARDALGEVQTLVRTLRDLPVAVAPARERLLAVVAASRAAGITVRATIDGDLPEPGGTVVVRVVQESLSNALRHMPGAECTVDVRSGTVVVHSVGVTRPDPAVDPGAGMELSVGLEAGMDLGVGLGVGLEGLRERVELVGGELRWEAPRAGEFLVTARVPA
ncbi:sensor histidine kinase [Dactylosporangium sp. NPDC051541]|uniref:sensor histidine kinase n=1 Tax=Dactylosporangium sp. NPDC051541 TaxID=3363977 RepID=UPI0037B7A8B1